MSRGILGHFLGLHFSYLAILGIFGLKESPISPIPGSVELPPAFHATRPAFAHVQNLIRRIPSFTINAPSVICVPAFNLGPSPHMDKIMIGGVFTNYQIGMLIIVFIPIDMMDNCGRREKASEGFFGGEDMFFYSAVRICAGVIGGGDVTIRNAFSSHGFRPP